MRRKPEVVSIDNFKPVFFAIDNFVTSCRNARIDIMRALPRGGEGM